MIFRWRVVRRGREVALRFGVGSRIRIVIRRRHGGSYGRGRRSCRMRGWLGERCVVHLHIE